MAENTYTYGDMLIAAGAIFVVLALILFLMYKFLYSNLNKRTEKILEQDNGELNSEILDLVVSLKKHEDPPQYVKHINKKLSNIFDSCKITDRKTVSVSESSYGLIALTAEDHMFTYLTNLGPLIENEVQKYVNGEEMATCAENISLYKASVEKSKAIKNKLIERLLQVPEQYSTVMKVTNIIVESLRNTHSEDEEIIKILDNISECAKSKGESCGGILTSQNNKNDMIDVINKIQEYDSIYNKDRNGNMSLVCYAAYKNLFAYLEVFFGGLHGIYKK